MGGARPPPEVAREATGIPLAFLEKLHATLRGSPKSTELRVIHIQLGFAFILHMFDHPKRHSPNLGRHDFQYPVQFNFLGYSTLKALAKV